MFSISCASTRLPSGREWVLDNEAIASRRARRCSQRVQRLCSWDAIVPRYVEVYRRAVARGTAAPG